MSLYADLLGDGKKKPAPGTVISAAPVTYAFKQEPVVADPVAATKKRDAALQFSPRAPQPKAKAKPRPAFNSNAFKPAQQETSSSPAQNTNSQAGKDINYWITQGNDGFEQPKPKRQNKTKKEKRQDALTRRYDEIYDPEQPCNFREYKGSSEQEDERREWKDLLYSKAGGGRHSSKRSITPAVARNTMFAPPPMDTVMSDAPATTYNDATGEDAYARRAAMAGMTTNQMSPPPRPYSASPAPSAASDSSIRNQQKIAELQARVAAYKASASPTPEATQGAPGLGATTASGPTIAPAAVVYTQPAPPDATISRAPVVYQQTTQQAPPPESKPKPAKMGLGQRLLEKQGWTAGQGLGANEDGITSIVHVQAEKRKKRPDAEGGGFKTAPMGKITGGKRKAADDGEPTQSPVIKVAGLLRGMNVKHAIEEEDLQQSLGTFFDERFGKVKRVVIWTAERGGNDEVFVEFVDALSALRAASPHKQHFFAGSEVFAAYFDAARFEAGDYEDS